MKSNYKTIEDLVIRIDERNFNNETDILLGVSIDKCFIPSVANTIGTDLTKYKLIRKNDFAVSLMQVSRDSRIPIARQKGYEVAMMSPAYPIFRVKNPDEILPEYLEMWFKRDEFDREAAFIAVGGVRGSMPWNEFAQMQVYVPQIDEQRKIVEAYKIVEDRIELKRKINDNLAATLDTLFCKLYEQLSDDDSVSLDTVCSLASSKRVFADDYSETGIPFYRGKEITLKQFGKPITEPLYIEKEHFTSLKEKYGIPTKGDILITAVGTIGNSYFVRDEEFYFKDGNIIWLKDFKRNLNYYIYDFMQTKIFKQMLDGICIGSTQTALTIVALSNLQIKLPKKSFLDEYTKQSIAVRTQIELNTDEISYFYELQSILLAELSR